MDLLAHNAVMLLLAIALDRFLPEPPAAIHPVVWMGRAAKRLERLAPIRPAPALLFGGLIVLVVAGGSTVVAWGAMNTLRELGEIAYVVGGALILRTTFTVQGLSRVARQTQQLLADSRIGEAQTALRSLVGRDPSVLSPSLMASATIESVAENTTDSFIGPWCAFALFGVPGAVAYRALNTLDSMFGYRGAYEYLGKIPARVDDIINLIPARLGSALLLAAGAVTRMPARRGYRTMMADHGLPASPNAGWTMGAMAGLLGKRLEKPNHYCLGQGFNQPTASDIGRAVVISETTGWLALLVLVAVLFLKNGLAG